MNLLLNDILVERQRQIKRYGEQHLTENQWFDILMKEIYELGEQIKIKQEERDRPLYNDVVQIAAVALAWMEDLKRGTDTPYIRCPKCNRISYNENDIKDKYCGNCHQFHEFLEPNNVSAPSET